MQIAILGLGYVGLPLALALAKKFPVLGFDINTERINLLIEEFKDSNIVFTSNASDLEQSSFYMVAVPTPVDKYHQPDLTALLLATETVGGMLKKGDVVVYESTVYPCCTEEKCIPLLEKISGLKCGQDFKIGYSPERINPGDKVHTLETVKKVVSGCDAEAVEAIARIYETIVDAGIYKAPSIRVAEAAKIIENTQRDVNIALMNELSIIFGRMGINTFDVLEAANTKWNFLDFKPGLVGGHCIGVDPYYLVHKAKELKYHPQIINAGRFINDSMGGYVGKKIVKNMIAENIQINGAKVLVQGITFKENVPDIRNSKVIDLIKELQDYSIDVDVADTVADALETKEMYGITLVDAPCGKYDAVVLAVTHDIYRAQTLQQIKELCRNKLFLFDLKGVFRKDIKNYENEKFYWSL
ncbi:MAG: nucleotide sugar dehydrogenase [Bacteroidales bacterium]|jgi:UDP-N-acetyl-D-galactosamine dehydrogenase|nr:nucleotide sugar dehydrogenase [Bacteroidales bacterium]